MRRLETTTMPWGAHRIPIGRETNTAPVLIASKVLGIKSQECRTCHIRNTQEILALLFHLDLFRHGQIASRRKIIRRLSTDYGPIPLVLLSSKLQAFSLANTRSRRDLPKDLVRSQRRWLRCRPTPEHGILSRILGATRPLHLRRRSDPQCRSTYRRRRRHH